MNCNLQTSILWWRNSYEHFSCASGRLVKYFQFVVPWWFRYSWNCCRTETFNSLAIGLPFHHFWRDHLSREMSTFLPQSCQIETNHATRTCKERCQLFAIPVSNLFMPVGMTEDRVISETRLLQLSYTWDGKDQPTSVDKCLWRFCHHLVADDALLKMQYSVGAANLNFLE